MIRFQLVSLSGKKFDDQVYEITVPTIDGDIGVLERHMPLISVAKSGAIYVRRKSSDADNMRDVFYISGGAIEVEDNVLTILADEADKAEELNETEIQAAIDQAKKMKLDAKDEISLEKAQELIDRNQVRLAVASLKRHNRK